MSTITTSGLPNGIFTGVDQVIGNQGGATKRLTLNVSGLSDYEEGTWTPTLYGGTVTGVTDYQGQYGHYVKIGNILYAVFDMDWSNTTASGTAYIGGLPFVTKSLSGSIRHSVEIVGYGDFSLPTDERIGGYIADNQNYITLLGNKINYASVLTIANMANNGYIRGSLTCII